MDTCLGRIIQNCEHEWHPESHCLHYFPVSCLSAAVLAILKALFNIHLIRFPDDLKHVLGSETTRHGLLNFFQMLQNRKLNLRLMLILLNDILTTLYQTESMTQHVTADR